MASRNQLRELMRSTSRKQEDEARINSPLVKYNAEGIATCLICQTPVKNADLWLAHCASKLHREKVEALKKKKAEKEAKAAMPPPVPSRPAAKATSSSSAESASIKVSGTDSKKRAVDDKDRLDNGINGGPSKRNREDGPSVPAASQKGLPSNFFDGLGEEADEDEELATPLPASAKSDASLSEAADGRERPKGPVIGAVPKGFFDDEDADLKARGIEKPKVNMDAELAAFQRELRSMAEKEDEERQDEYEDEAEERVRYEEIETQEIASKVVSIKDKVLQLKRKLQEKAAQVKAEYEKELDEDAFIPDDRFLDWRAKIL